ncbi:MAG: cysteine desulfurase [Clostridiales bacterium]|jgi:cysteine desulfurase/selenocysteine lyase|nr:cysteine desulfurase [Clostridiales bacterium]
MRNFDIEKIRNDFPALSRYVHEKPLVYLDNAATTHKPQVVLDSVADYYRSFNANPHRGAHFLGVTATELYEASRETVRDFINASSSNEIIFTKNATEALNLIAYSYGMVNIEEGDEIVLCISEHHSNIVPWQNVAKSKKASLKYMYLDENHTLDLKEVYRKITDKTKLVSIAHMSNVLGTIYPVKEIVEYAHQKGAVVVIDGAQSVPHMKTDVRYIDADFLVFSGHKLMGPMGIGVLYGREELLLGMPPFLMGGDMIEYVEEETTTYAELPYKFEAGTPNVGGAIGLAAAIEYLSEIGFEALHKHEIELTTYALKRLKELPYVTIYGHKNPEQRGPVISFSMKGCHPHDVASIVDTYGVALRAGHHCAQPLMAYLKAPASSRISFYIYNTIQEIDILIDSLKKVRKWFL